ncbi:MAG: BLUF domain-containing protein [bacterium]|nr:BLUF domain-containing protein [bacterium]
MIQLIYASSAVRLFSGEALLHMLEKSRTNNEKLGITGMLLYQGGNFLQVLEGQEQAVMPLYSKIQQDPRHYDVTTIMKRPLMVRLFDDWQMGFVNLDEIDLTRVPGYTSYLNQPFEPEHFVNNPTRAYIFLRTFKEFRH